MQINKQKHINTLTSLKKKWVNDWCHSPEFFALRIRDCGPVDAVARYRINTSDGYRQCICICSVSIYCIARVENGHDTRPGMRFLSLLRWDHVMCKYWYTQLNLSWSLGRKVSCPDPKAVIIGSILYSLYAIRFALCHTQHSSEALEKKICLNCRSSIFALF